MIPVIETPRLKLRGRTLEDFPAYAAMWGAPEVARHTTVTPLSREDAWGKFARMAGFWALAGYGFWLVEERATGAMIGEIGLADFRREISPALDGMPEFGWVLAPAAHGKGYAKEAAAAAIGWAEEKFPQTTFCCIIDPENAPSIAVAAALDFKPAGSATYKGKAISVFHRIPTS